MLIFFFFQAEDGIRDYKVTGVQTCALPIYAEASPFHRERLRHHVQAGLRHRRRHDVWRAGVYPGDENRDHRALDRKSTRLNSSHLVISYAVFCLEKKRSGLHAALK